MKYKVKNTVTGEEILCEKVVVGEFDYYVTGDDFHLKNLQNNDFAFHWKTKEILTVLEYTGITADWLCLDGTKRDSYKLKKVVATTNKSLDLPVVIDEVEENYYKELEQRREVAKNFKGQVAGRHPDFFGNTEIHNMVRGYLDGYKRAKETYSYTKDDMVEFVEYLNIQYRDLEHTKALKEIGSISELIDLWQEQRIIKILVK